MYIYAKVLQSSILGRVVDASVSGCMDHAIPRVLRMVEYY